MFGIKLAARAGVAAAIICGALSSAPAQTATKPPAESFAVLPVKVPLISPDGSRFALIRGINGRPAVAVYKMDAPKDSPQIVTSNDWLIAGMRWVKNDVLIIYDKMNKRLGDDDMLRPVGGAAAVLLNENKLVKLAAYPQIIDVDLDNPDTIYLRQGHSIYSMNVRTGAMPQSFVRSSAGPDNDATAKWFMDGHGEAIMRVDSVRDQKSFHNAPRWHHTLKVLDHDKWRDLGTYDETVDISDGIEGISEDGNAVIRLAPDGTSTRSLERIDVGTGTTTRLFHDTNYDVVGALRDEWTGRVVGYEVDEDMSTYTYFDPGREALQRGLEQAFRGLSVHAVSSDLSDDRVIVETVGPKTPESYYLYDRTTRHAMAIAASYPDLKEGDLGDVKPYGYSARDGLHIPAYLTLPPGRDPHKLPFVVMPHGGPDERDDMSFDFMSQFLANRGYAVLRPEFRGSWGYGRAFTEAGFHQWGLKMQDDISDGVKKAVADGIADPKRVCIFGTGIYGGYAALAGATLSPDLYNCAISFEGVSNLEDMLGYFKKEFGIDFTNGSYWVVRIGDSFKDADRLNATSPVLHADRVKAPVLLLHCELDITVPISQSEMMAAALQKAGKKVEFVRIPGDDHYMTLESTRLRVLQEVEKFLAANIGS